MASKGVAGVLASSENKAGTLGKMSLEGVSGPGLEGPHVTVDHILCTGLSYLAMFTCRDVWQM